MDWLFDLLRFCRDSVLQLVNLIGGIVGVSWLLFERWRGKEVSLKTFFVIVGICLFFGMFNAWREQYLKNKEIRLRGEIIGLGSGQTDSEAAIYLVMSVTNTGPPTIATDFSATIETGNEKIRMVRPS